MATIDSLDIQIGSSAKLANQAIDSLIKNLDRLSKSLNIDTSKLSNIGKALNFSGIEKTAKSVESQMQKISKSAAKVAKDFENKFKDISVKVDFSRPEAELKKFQKQAQTAENALSRIMASSSADKQTAGIEKWSISLARANNAIKILKSHMDGLQTAQPQFDFKMAGAESSIKFLVEYKKQLMDLKNDIKSMSDVYGGLQNIPKGGLDTPIQNLKQSIEKLKQSYPQATNVISAFEQELQKLQTISAGLTKEPTKINFDESSIDRINEKITELKNKFKKVGSDFKFQGNFEQLNIEIEKVYSKLSELRTKEQEMISAGKVDTSAFEQLQESLAKIGNKFGIMQDLRDRTESFNQSLQQLRVPEIREENLTKLQNSLRKTEEDVEKLRIKLANQISMGNIIPNIDDSGFRKLTEQIALSEKQAEALRSKIQELGGDTNKTSSTTNTLGKNIKKLSSSMNGFTKSAGKAVSGLKSFARQLLSGMGIYLGVYGAAKGLKKSIESSMDYIEILNYFDAAFGQVAENADLSAFEEMGYDSAQAYYNSFAQRAEELTAKMSGFTVGEGGLLESTGAVSLGLDPGQLMNYQAMFGQMASSMGVASETSLDLSQALTEIAADLASVKNLNFEDVWNDMASGLAGMSRTLDKYGVNIRNVNLQQKLNELGIDANISALNQNDKALLRTIVLLDSTKYAWGDLADTINQPSNQLRMIQANFQNLSRTIGNLFLPIVKTVLPYINALVIAVQRLFAWLGNLIGIDINDISTSIGSTDISGFLDQTDDLSDSLGGVANNAKKAKAGLRAFDELKTISMPEETNAGTGLGGIGGGLLDAAFQDAFSEYQKTWDKAFGKLENRAQELADKIEKAFEPVKKIIQDFAIGDFFQAGKDTSTLVVSIFDFFADAIDRVDWEQIGHNIGNFLDGIDWFAILKSVGNLIWQALKAAFEFYVGAFSVAPLETAVISLVAMPKLLKAITASKIMNGTKKLWQNFAIWGEKLKLTGKRFSDLKKTISQQGLWKTIDGGITNIRNNLGGLQKAAIVAVAGFAEFSVVSNSVEKLTLGTENWLAEIGKIAGVVAAAGAAMYVALGPAGLAITAITGVVAAVKGINGAFDAIRAEEIGISIKNAMSNPGGVPLSEVTAQFSDAIGGIGESFNVITEKASGLDQADSHIRDTWMEIEKIETSMDAGVISVEEGTEKLTQLFGELAQTASDKFRQLEDTLLVAFGENGVLNQVFERLGISTDNTTSTIIQLNDKVEKRIEELTKLLAETDPSNPNYAIYREELAELTSQTDELAQTISDYDFALKNIDYSDLLLPDGTLDTTALQNFLKELKTATETANTDIENAIGGIRKSLEEELRYAVEGTPEYEEIKTKLDVLPDALELLKSDVALKATELTDTIQIDFIDKISEVIEGAEKTWTEKSPWDQFWQGLFGGPQSGTEYVKEAADKQKENIDELSSEIEKYFANLKVDGAAWASEAVEEIYGKLFDTGTAYSGRVKTAYYLNENYKDIINEATEGISELASERGNDAVDGYANGITDNISTGTDAAKSFTEKVLEKIAEVQESHSPSKVTQELGKNAVDGYTIGILSNTDSTLAAVSGYTDKVLNKFAEVINPMKQIGIDAMNGLYNGLSSMELSIYSKVGNIAENVAKTIKTALDIHSPSRVMFELGDYTMQGFQNGLENLYQPILASVKTFGRDLRLAPAPNLADMYGNYQYQSTAYAPQDGMAEYAQNGYNQSDPEMKSLLRRNNELLAAILAKPNIGKEEIYSANKELYQMESIRRYGRPDAYDPILGS